VLAAEVDAIAEMKAVERQWHPRTEKSSCAEIHR